jgi:FADH2 O2-dependent halogenase
MRTLAGPGWFLIGDAARFVDPVFSSGVDVAMHSAAFAYEAMLPLLLLGSWKDADETFAAARYEERVNRGIELWHQTIELFYRHQQTLGQLVADQHHTAEVARVLQGNPYEPQYRLVWERLRAALPGLRATPATVSQRTS